MKKQEENRLLLIHSSSPPFHLLCRLQEHEVELVNLVIAFKGEQNLTSPLSFFRFFVGNIRGPPLCSLVPMRCLVQVTRAQGRAH